MQAPKELRELLLKYLDVVRLPELARGETIEAVELDRLVAAAPAQVRELLETEGYFDAEVQAERDGQMLRLSVTPGPRTPRLAADAGGAGPAVGVGRRR